MKLNITPISSDRFNFTKDDGIFSIEISDLGPNGGDLCFQRLYDDACDVGLAIQSSKTGTVVTYYMRKQHHNDGDTTHWEFWPTTEAMRHYPSCINTKVIVWND